MSPYVAAGAFFFPEKWSLDFGGDSQMDLDLDIIQFVIPWDIQSIRWGDVPKFAYMVL